MTLGVYALVFMNQVQTSIPMHSMRLSVVTIFLKKNNSRSLSKASQLFKWNLAKTRIQTVQPALVLCNALRLNTESVTLSLQAATMT